MGPSAYYICIYTGNKRTNRGEQVFSFSRISS